MNLLKNPWIPVRENHQFQLISFEQLLCEDGAYEIAIARDDLEMAAWQLLICLTQILFLPRDKSELIARIKEPLSPAVYEEAIADYFDWFDLLHPDHPFMQNRDVKAKEPTPIQKLFPGLPEGNSHTHFNDQGEIRSVSLPIAAIALFNQASNAKGFGGGFKDGLRGVPITTLARLDQTLSQNTNADIGKLRRNIWLNVLSFDHLKLLNPAKYNSWDFDHYQSQRVNDKPTWIAPIKEKEMIDASHIGLMRGLFWQPQHVELCVTTEPSKCDLLNIETDKMVKSFAKEKFTYTIQGLWPHPHSPSQLHPENGEVYFSFRNKAPAWTQLSQFIIDNCEQGQKPAAVIRQYANILPGKPMDLAIGGYLTNQAKIKQRRHELISLSSNWHKDAQHLNRLIQTALDRREELTKKIWSFGKQIDDQKNIANKLSKRTEQEFYRQTEQLIHNELKTFEAEKFSSCCDVFTKKISIISQSIFDELTEPFQNKPKILIALSKARQSLRRAFYKLDHHPS